MAFGYCNLSFIPTRAEPSDKSEMINQVLFGEHFDVLDENEKWYKIRLDHDDYEGWVDKMQVVILSEDDENNEDSDFLVQEVSAFITDKSRDTELNLVLGSLIPKHENGAFRLGETAYQFDGLIASYDDASLDDVGDYAHLYINTPYLWGGRTPFGIDCSGFTQMVFRMCGAALARDSHEQAEEGEPLDHLEDAEEGDLAFFCNDKGRITHVGIVLQGNESDGLNIIHASGRVRIDKLDEKGIYNADKQEYSHQLDSIRTFCE